MIFDCNHLFDRHDPLAADNHLNKDCFENDPCSSYAAEMDLGIDEASPCLGCTVTGTSLTVSVGCRANSCRGNSLTRADSTRVK